MKSSGIYNFALSNCAFYALAHFKNQANHISVLLPISKLLIFPFSNSSWRRGNQAIKTLLQQRDNNEWKRETKTFTEASETGKEKSKERRRNRNE
jgi:hypothetical protein